MVDGQDSLLDGRIGGDDQVVLVLPHGILSLLAQDPDDFQRDVLKADGLPDGI